MADDKRLIRQFKQGRKEAMKQIYEKYKVTLLKTAIILTNNADAAEDIVQDVFISFAQRAKELKAIGNLRNYLITAVVNKVRNRIRDVSRKPVSAIDDADRLPSREKSGEQWAILNEQLALLSEAMNDIPYEQREIITLKMEGNMTFKQIAELEEMPIATVQGRFRYGIEKLRKLLKNEVTK